MAGCDTENDPGQGDYKWSKGRVTTWALIGFFAGWTGMLVALGLAGATGLAGAGAVLFAGLAIGLASMFIGYGVEWFTRLKAHDPEEITFTGWAVCAARNLGNWGLGAWDDGDWTFNVAPTMPGVSVDPAKTWAVNAPTGLTVEDVRTRVAPDAEFAGTVHDPRNGLPILHTEISSHIGDYAAAGGAIGAGVGLAAGIAAGIAICAAVGVLTFGIGFALCALIIAAAAAAGAFVGGAGGQWVGGAIGGLVDLAEDFDSEGDAIHEGCFVTLTGTWVTDRSHQHNEIHDIKSIVINECGTAGASSPLTIAGAVGIGRHPSGPDP